MLLIRQPLPLTPQDLKALTSLRFFAALWVVLFHMKTVTPAGGPLISALVSRGALGVDLFFILSGFIMMHVYSHQFESGKFFYRSFLRNRLARIYPLHLFITMMFVALYYFSHKFHLLGNAEGMNWSHLIWHVLALHAWGFTNGHSWNFPSWSISAEFFAYLIFPLYLLISKALRPLYLATLAIVAFIAFNILLGYAGLHISQLMFNFGISRIFFEFLLGVSAYKILAYARPSCNISLALSAAAAIFVIAGSIAGFSEAVIIIFFFLLILGLASFEYTKNPDAFAFMRAPILVWLGEISYSTYMIHYFVILTVSKAFERIGSEGLQYFLPLVILFVVYAASAVLYYTIELPFRERLRAPRSQLS